MSAKKGRVKTSRQTNKNRGQLEQQTATALSLSVVVVFLVVCSFELFPCCFMFVCKFIFIVIYYLLKVFALPLVAIGFDWFHVFSLVFGVGWG